jgi:hypothetical protein
VITRLKLTLLPVSTAVITAVEAIARSEGQSGLKLTSHGGHLISDSALIAGVGEDDDIYQDDVYQDDDEHQDTDAIRTTMQTTRRLRSSQRGDNRRRIR